MTNSIEDMIQELGTLVLSNLKLAVEDVLLYVEVEDGGISADLFFSESSNVLTSKIAPETVYDYAWKFWKAWKSTPGYVPWFSMSYLVRNGQITVEMKYPDQVDLDESPIVRREAEARAVLGNKEIDNSDPWF